MHERFVFDYAVVRIVPRVDRGEFLNAGVIVFSPTAGFLDCRIELDHARLLALAPSIDIAVVESYLDAIPKICAGGGEAGSIGDLAQRARFHWLVAPRSTVIQTSAVHSGVHENPKAALDGLFEKLVRMG
jgi:molybdopterin-guanine dinucleotide biosynthesis protein